MYTICVTNQKGGVGKTTSVANRAAAFAKRGFRVLAVDADPQGSLTLCYGIDPMDVAATIGDTMLTGAPLPILQTSLAGLDLCPSNRTLADIEPQLMSKVGRERFLVRALHQVRYSYNFVFLDTPPTLGLLTVNCLTAANALLVPVIPALLSAAGLRDLLTTVGEVRDGINEDLRLAGVFVTFSDTRTIAAREKEAELREDLGNLVFTTTISRRVAHEYGAQAGAPVVLQDPSSVAAQEYCALAQEVLQRVSAK
ncbi:MAG: ParA family protein [Armatimonadetes bacterium]|nr:ParA family protein [Armatimonadota bacterium]